MQGKRIHTPKLWNEHYPSFYLMLLCLVLRDELKPKFSHNNKTNAKIYKDLKHENGKNHAQSRKPKCVKINKENESPHKA